MPPANPTRLLRLVFVPIRILLITLLLTLLSLAVSLLLGIVGIVIAAKLRGTEPNLTLAYRYVALPAAAIVGAIVLVSAIVIEIRNYRQSKALAQIARAA